MPKKIEIIKKDAFRPQVNIDWNLVDKLLEAGCKTTEIAAHIGCCPDTLYVRCTKDKGLTFSAYSQEKKQKGESLLRAAQFNKAMKGDNTMLIWLGKHRLDQHENVAVVNDDILKKFDDNMKQLRELQIARKMEETNISSDSKSR
jgi:hypothetical protein